MEGFLTNSQIGNYRILSLIGKGGMGEVYKAQHVHLETLAAIKILMKTEDTDIRLVESFLREARTAAQIRHNNIVEVYDVGETEDFWYLTMEYVPGIDCAKLIRTHKIIPLADAIKIAKEAALGLQAVHEKGLVHRDIKPHNLYITKQLVVKVGDFGLVQYQKTVQELSNKIAGTPAYMAPEQVMDVKKIGPTTDIYSLGATFYQMITGQQLYQGKSSHEILFALFRGEEFPSCRDLVPDIPEELDRIIRKMIEREPYQRYQSMKDFIQDLEDFERLWQPEPGLVISQGESLLTETEIQIISESATQPSTSISSLDNNPSRSNIATREQKIICLPKNISMIDISQVTDSLDRGGTEEMTTNDASASSTSSLARLTPVTSFRVPPPFLQKKGTAEITFDERAAKQNVSAEVTFDERLRDVTEERKSPLVSQATGLYLKPELRSKSKFSWFWIGGICFLILLGIIIFIMAQPSSKITLQVIATVNQQGEVRTEFEVNEPIFLLLIFQCEGKITPFLAEIKGSGLETFQRIISPIAGQNRHDEKIPIKVLQSKPGTYDIKVTYKSSNVFTKNINFTLIPQQFDLNVHEIYLTNETGKVSQEFFQGEKILLFFKWDIISRMSLTSPLMLDISGDINLQQILLAKPTANDYTQQIQIPRIQTLGLRTIHIRLSLEDKFYEKKLEFSIKKRVTLEISSVKIVDATGIACENFDYSSEAYLALEWKQEKEEYDFLKIEFHGDKIRDSQQKVPVTNQQALIPIIPLQKEAGKYLVNVLVHKGENLLFSQALSWEWKKPEPKIILESFILCDAQSRQKTEFAFGDPIYGKIQWQGQETYIAPIHLKIICQELMIKPLEKELPKMSGEKQEILIPLTLRSQPGTYLIQAILTLGEISSQRQVTLKISNPELAMIEIHPKNPKIKQNNLLQFNVIGYTKDFQKLNFTPIWQATGGSIKEDGTYIAGKISGIYQVKVRDIKTNIEAQTNVEIMSSLSKIIIEPSELKSIQPRETIILRVQGYSSNGSKIDFIPQWTAIGGNLVIAQNPYEATYIAGQELGQFYISVKDQETGIYTNLTCNISLNGWFGESLLDGMARGQQIGEYIYQKDNSIMVYVPSDYNIQQGFYIDKYELSVEQFNNFVQATNYITSAERAEYTTEWDGMKYPRVPKNWKNLQSLGSQYPVIYISPDDILTYTKWSGKRIPNYNQWVRAAGRSQKIPNWDSGIPVQLKENPLPARKYPWGDQSAFKKSNIAVPSWTRRGDDGFEFLAPIDSFPQGISPFGCFNMAGNVYEYTSEPYFIGGAWCYGEEECTLNQVRKVERIITGNNYVGVRFIVNRP